MLQKNRGGSEILEKEKTSKIKGWDFPRGHYYNGRCCMSTHITKNRILDFTVSMKIKQRSANTINSYTTNIQKPELFLREAELTKEQMLLYKQWLSTQGFK